MDDRYRMLPSVEWHVNGVKYGVQTKTSDVCTASLGHPYESTNFKQELRMVLLWHWGRYGKGAIMYSGGADSEMIARELQALNKRPELHFIRFDCGSNDPDYQHALEFQKSSGLPLHVHDHNIQAFLNSKQHIELGLRYGTSDVSVLTVYKYAQNLGMPVFLGPELMLQKHQRPGHVNAEDDWYILVGEHSTSADRFMQAHRTPMFGELYYYGPELLNSVLKLQGIRDLTDNKIPGRISLTNLKNRIFSEALGYEFVASKKRHGYEAVYPTFRRAVNEVKNALPFIPFEVRIPYSTALQNER